MQIGDLGFVNRSRTPAHVIVIIILGGRGISGGQRPSQPPCMRMRMHMRSSMRMRMHSSMRMHMHSSMRMHMHSSMRMRMHSSMRMYMRAARSIRLIYMYMRRHIHMPPRCC